MYTYCISVEAAQTYYIFQYIYIYIYDIYIYVCAKVSYMNELY